MLAIIPARGGSKTVPRKNIRKFAGKPLIVWTIRAALKSRFIDRLVLSSEDDEIIKIAQKHGCEVPFKRPAALSEDDTPGIDPVLFTVQTLHEKYDYVCLLQPTSPLRQTEDIDGCIEKCVSLNAPSCVTVTQAEKHPYWMYEMDANERLLPLFPEKEILRRQELNMLYFLNGAVYVIRTDVLLHSKKFVDHHTLGYVMRPENSVDIDTEMDFQIAENIQLSHR